MSTPHLHAHSHPVYNHRSLGDDPMHVDAPPPVSVPSSRHVVQASHRFNELLDKLREEHELGYQALQRQRDDYEVKLSAQLNELNSLKQALYDLEATHTRVRQSYEEEIKRLRALLTTQQSSSGATSSGSLLPLTRERDRERDLRERDRYPAPHRPDLADGLVLLPPKRMRSRSRERERDRDRDILSRERDRDVGVGVAPVPGPLPLRRPSSPLLPPSHSDRSRPTSSGVIPPLPLPHHSRDRERDVGILSRPTSQAGRVGVRDRDRDRSPLPLPLSNPSASNGTANPTLTPGTPGYLYDLDPSTIPPEWKKEGSDWYAVWNPSAPPSPSLSLSRSHPNSKRLKSISLLWTFIHSSVVCCVRFSADGKYLATGCNRTAQIYDVKTGAKVCVLPDGGGDGNSMGGGSGTGGDLYIRSVCFSPDGKLLATGAEDRQIRVWDISKRRIRHIFDGHQQEIYSLDFSLDGRLIVSGSGDRTARIWDLGAVVAGEAGTSDATTTTATTTTDESTANPNAIANSNSKTPTVKNLSRVFTITDSPPSPPSPQPNSTSNSNAAPSSPLLTDSGITSVVISPDGKFVAAGSLDYLIRVWDVESGEMVCRLGGHEDSVYSVAWVVPGANPNSNSTSTANPNSASNSNSNAGASASANGSANSTGTGGGGKQQPRFGLVSASLDRTLKYWDLSWLYDVPRAEWSRYVNARRDVLQKGKGEGEVTFVGHKDFVLSVAVSHDSKWVVSGSKDRGVQFWDLRSGIVECMLQGHKNSVISVDFSRAGGMLATGSGDSQARIWTYTS